VKPEAQLIDTHAHLGLDPLSRNPGEVVERAAEEGVMAILTIGIDLEQAYLALNIAERFEHVFASIGFHPHNASLVDGESLAQMAELARRPKVKGYGEIGLDFYRNRSTRDHQIAAFADQLNLAKKLELPVVVHLRDAYREGLEMLEAKAPFPSAGVVHCFSGKWEDAERTLALGFYISFPGTVTYKGNDRLRDLVRRVPLDRILLETDCPFLSPEPLRGRVNEPAHMVHTAMKVAEIRQVSFEEIARTTTGNANQLFHLNLE
jgi:TatD DNase family protein